MGYQFFRDVSEKNGLECESAKGEAKIFSSLASSKIDKEIVVVADGAAFASEMNRIISLMRTNKRIHLYLPESFEYLILSSGIIKDSKLYDILTNPSDYIDSSLFFSWERFFTSLIVEKTKDTYLAYNKSKLNSAYLKSDIQNKILAHIEGIRFNRTDSVE